MHHRPKAKREDLPLDNSEAMNESPIPNISAEELGHHIVVIRKELREIKVALIGNEYGTPGLIPRMDSAETSIKAHDKKFIVWSAILTAAGTALVFLKDYLHINKP